VESGFINRISRFSTKEKMAFRKKTLVFSFFLLLSVIFWFMNALSKNYTTDIDYPVIYRRLPSDKVLVGELPENLNLKINAHGYTLLRYYLGARQIPIIFNVQSFAMDIASREDSTVFFIETRYARDYFSRQLSSEFEVLEIKPDTLFFRFADVVSKMVPVEAALVYSLDQQLILKQDPVVTPDSVMISGPDFLVDSLMRIYTTDTDVGKISKSVYKTADLSEIQYVTLSQEKVRIFYEVEKYTEKILEASIQITNKPDTVSLKIFPGSVTITCQVGLSNFDKLQAGMFTAEVDYHEALLGQSNKIQVSIKRQPDFIKSLKYTPRSVEYLIEK
jgi:hypothetical protein